jgi:Ca-activated chloride channel family protein
MVIFIACCVAPLSLRAADLNVGLTSPPPGAPVFGEVEFVAEVRPSGSAATVEFFLDGERIAVLEAPPYTVQVDVGQQNREHHFEVRAYGPAGEEDIAVLVTPAIRIDEKVDINLREFYIVATREEERVLDLEQADFSILDNGAEQQIVTFGRGDLPLASVILVDASASMKGRRLGFALRGAAAFGQGMRSHDETSIQVFADRLLFESPFSSDPDVLTEGLAEIRAGGGTALNDHLYRALGLVEARHGRRVVVFLSDGFDSHSVIGTRELAWLARRSRALLYWIRLGSPDSQLSRYSAWKNPEGYREDYQRLEKMVLESGGRIVSLERIEETDRAVQVILEELREQYVLGFYPELRRRDGSWHKVNVRVRRPWVSVRTRGGYVDY